MEAGVLLILLSIIVILQVFILINQFLNKKLLIERLETKSSFIEKSSSLSQKESEMKCTNRNFSTPSSSSSVNTPKDDIEKSLRNINLKLKNAERNQEAARRKVQENINSSLVKEKSQNDNFPHGKDRKKDYRNKKHRKDNRNRHFVASHSEGGSQGHHHSAQQTVQGEEKKEVEILSNTYSSFEELKPVDFNIDNPEHGRKIIVKRRPLKDEVEDTSPQSESSVENVSSISSKTEETTVYEPKTEEKRDNILSEGISSMSSEQPNMSDIQVQQPKEESTDFSVKDITNNTEISFGRR